MGCLVEHWVVHDSREALEASAAEIHNRTRILDSGERATIEANRYFQRAQARAPLLRCSRRSVTALADVLGPWSSERVW